MVDKTEENRRKSVKKTKEKVLRKRRKKRQRKEERKKGRTGVENPPLRVSGTVAGSLLAAFMVRPCRGNNGRGSEINTFFAD